MHKAYQPLKPATNKYLQKKWDHARYESHRNKVIRALPIVDTKGMTTPAHVQMNLKKLKLQDERLATIERDNRLLSSNLANIVRSGGYVDHSNHYPEKSLNANKRREELLHVARQNQAIYQRITARESEYRRQTWMSDWEKMERRQCDIARYPRRVANGQVTTSSKGSQRKVKFVDGENEENSDSKTDSSQLSKTSSDEEKEAECDK